MADKQATVYIVDVGRSMGEKNGGRDESDLDFGMRYIWDKIATTMAASRKTWTIGVIGLRTDEANTNLKDEEAYHHISIMQPIVGPFEIKHLKKLQDDVKISHTDTGDAISAIIIAIEMIENFTKKLKYFRKIVLVTNGTGHMDADGLDDIASKLNEDEIELVVVGVDFDDVEYGFKEEDKSPFKASNEGLLKTLVNKCDKATFGTVAEAVELLSVAVVKESRPYKVYEGQLTLGDPEKYDSAMCIDVERYFRTKKATPPSASSFVIRTDLATTEASQTPATLPAENRVDGDDESGAGLAVVKQTQLYKVDDPTVPGSKREVKREELAKGYEYGRTAVHISESDENVTKLETVKTFSIIGFIPREKYERFFTMGESCATIAQKTNDKARMALSSLIHALFELDSYAVARIVLKEGKDPKLLLLAPSIDADLECLIDIPLPFAEDVRLYRFPPLDRVITVSGTAITKHRNIPTDELTEAMSAYVDSMDLSSADKDEDGKPMEYGAIEDTYSPVLHRINQAIRLRATRPDEPIPPPAEVLIKYSKPPEELLQASSKQVAALITAADVKKVPPRAKGKRSRDAVKPLSGLDVEALLGREKRHKIAPDNAIAEFKQTLATTEDLDVIEDAAKQMFSIVRSLITHSVGDSGYGRAMENLGVMRQELLDLEMPVVYNGLVTELRNKILGGDLGGDRRDLWFKLRASKLGLITREKSELSEVTEEQAAEFYSMKSDLPLRGPK